MTRSWLKASQARIYMLISGSFTFLGWLVILYLYLLDSGVGFFHTILFLVETNVLFVLLLLAALGGPIMTVFWLGVYLYHRTGGKKGQLSILLLEGPEAGRIEIAKGTGIRVGLDKMGQPMISHSASSPPNQYWMITHEEGEWRIQQVTGTLKVYVNGNPIEAVCKLEPGDRIQVGDIRLSFDTFKNNRALMP